MNFLSICSGIEAVTVATAPLGWRAIAYSEIEKFPCAVLKHHHPNTPNLGDMTKFHEWPDFSINALIGGTPCQAFSVAGLRKGLADPRGNLTLTFLAVARRYWPRWVLWENVPGVLSDATGAFGFFLGGLEELGYGWAYRVLDAQFFGVPQRRRRVFVVGHLGDWQPAAAVLLEPASLRWDTPPSREAGQRVAGTITRSALDGSSACGGDGRENLMVAGTLQGVHNVRADQAWSDQLLPEVAWALQERDSKGADSSTKDGHLIPVAFHCKRGSEAGELSPTLCSMGHDGSHANAGGQVAVAFHENQRAEISCSDTAGSLKVGGGKPGQGYPAVATTMAVRRLTPRECERLQGFPDNYTRILYNGRPAEKCPDGPRYKALGNSMAVPVIKWIARRMQIVHEGVAS